MTLIFGMGVDLDLGVAGIVGQGRRSKVKVKLRKSVLVHFTLCAWRGVVDHFKASIIYKQGLLYRSPFVFLDKAELVSSRAGLAQCRFKSL